VERKRHLGNDIGVIVYIEEGGQFDPSLMTTQFNRNLSLSSPPPKTNKACLTHCFLNTDIYGIVSKQRDGMRMEFATKEGVKPFGPRLPSSQQFKLDQSFIDFLLAKSTRTFFSI